MKLGVVVMAAGEGKRMRSAQPKVLLPFAGKPLLSWVLNAARALNPDGLFLIGSEPLLDALGGEIPADVSWVLQKDRRGTGHAIMQALPAMRSFDRVLVLSGDVPLVDIRTLQALIEATPEGGVGMLTVSHPSPTGLGRILRDDGAVVGIVEERDATPEQRAIREVNTGVYLLPISPLENWLSQLSSDNAQGEYYLTDVIALARHDGAPIVAETANTLEEVEGVNDRAQLANLERVFHRQTAQRLMLAGVSIRDPMRVDFNGEVSIGRDTVVEPNVFFCGNVRIGEGCYISAGAHITDTELGDGVHVGPYCVIDGARIAQDSSVGPFARLRPGAELGAQSRVGNFVEVKKSIIGEGSKVSHLSYIGDAEIGSRVNIGAGTITCNYDGNQKHRTVIEDEVFVGSGAELVAPVRLGRGATIGAGTTLTRDAPAGSLTLSRAPQKTVQKWQRPQDRDPKDKSKEA